MSLDPLIGTLLGDFYRIIEVIGEGSVGKVYLAEHISHQLRSAIKVLRAEYTDHTEIAERFRREARAISRLEHPNIVRLERTGQTELRQIYMVMEYIEGPSLRFVLREQSKQPLARALDIIKQVCDAAAFAHQQSIIHRDFKPENLLLVPRKGLVARDLVKVLDFGMAKVLASGESQVLTREGQVFGTPAYMSPEQCLGQPVDVRADIYSIGIIAYELIAGRVPFWSSKYIELMMMQTEKEPRDPSYYRKDRKLPPDLCQDVLRCLEKNPDDRYQTIEEFQERIVEYLQRERRASSERISGFMEAIPDPDSRVGTDLYSAEDEFAVAAPTRGAEDTAAPGTDGGAEERGPAWTFSRYCQVAQTIAQRFRKAGMEVREVNDLHTAATKAEEDIIREETEIALLEAKVDEADATKHDKLASLHAGLFDLSEQKEGLLGERQQHVAEIVKIDREIASLERRRDEVEAAHLGLLQELESELDRRLVALPELHDKLAARHLALGDAVERHKPESPDEKLGQLYDELRLYRLALDSSGYVQ